MLNLNPSFHLAVLISAATALLSSLSLTCCQFFVVLLFISFLMQPQQRTAKENTTNNTDRQPDETPVYPPRNPLLRALQIIYSIYALLLFIILMFVTLIVVAVSPLLGKTRGGNFVYTACKGWAIVWYFLTGNRYKEIHEAPHDATKQYIFVANHTSYMDIPAAMLAIHQPVRILGKYEMVKYPVFGIIYRMAVIVVDRSSSKRRAQSFRALKAALLKHISIFIFPEGTFNETRQPLKDFYDGAFRIAIETKTPIKPILFLDTYERMHYRGFLELTPGKCRCVYLPQIEVEEYDAKQVAVLRKKVYDAMEEGLRRYRNYPLPLNVY